MAYSYTDSKCPRRLEEGTATVGGPFAHVSEMILGVSIEPYGDRLPRLVMVERSF